MKLRTTLIILAALPAFLFGQSYNTALGMRLGTDYGVTVKQRVGKTTSLEAIIQSSLQREEAQVSLLAEQHFPLISRRFNVYAGGGLHKGWVTREGTEEGPVYKDPFGMSLIAGIEFSLGRLNLSYDFKPAVNLTGGKHTIYSQTGVSLRYVVAKRPWLNGNDKEKRRRQRERERRRRNKDKEGFNWKFWENW
ncbi:MAG: hypothetical protein KDD19_15265 [Phaeodactylibacter sp.]|nr:hypothetical protein [Phaeodactylibacter sp.]MCB9050359.1 hypothetical protein [Lewinellaceae bacterium]